MLKNMYINRGLSTVYLISHPYVGTSSSPLWAGKVVALMLKYRGEAPPPSIVVQHSKKVAGSRAKTQTSAISLARQGQTGEASKQTANTTRQLKTPAVLPLSIEYTIVVFALLLALAIAAWALWLEKRPGHTMVGVQAYDEIIQVKGEQDGKSQGEIVQGEIVPGGGKPRPYYIRNARPFRRIALDVLVQNENAPNTDALITTAQGIELDTVKTDALVMWTQEMDTGANFRIRRKIFLPSTPVVETAKSGESPVGSTLGRLSTGLLSRYGEIQQE